MIVPMKYVTLLCMETEKVHTLEQLGQLSLMHLKTVEQRTTPSDDETLLLQQCGELEKVIAAVSASEKKKNIATSLALGDKSVADYLFARLNERNALEKKLEQSIRDYDALLPWGNFDRNAFAELEKHGVHIKLCSSDKKVFKRDIACGTLAEQAVIQVIEQNKTTVQYVVIYTQTPSVEIADEVVLPVVSLEQVKKDIASAKEILKGIATDFSIAKNALPELKKDLGHLRSKTEFVQAEHSMLSQGGISFICGYVPETELQNLRNAADRNGWALLIDEPDSEDTEIPTYIRKKKFLDILDPLFDFIGITPGYYESDVYLFFFLFFPLFFGMIVGDAGYSVLLICAGVIGRVLLRGKTAAQVAPVNLLIYLSSFSLLWGWLNGAWFGMERALLPDILSGWNFFVDPKNSPFALKFLNFYHQNVNAPNYDWASVSNKFVQYLCFLLAAIHLSLAHVVRFFTGIRKDWRAIAHIGWFGMIVSNFILATSLIVFPGTFPGCGVYFYIASVLLIFITVRPADYLSLPNDLIGSFVDVLSYIRLFAVGLSGAYIAQKFNMMGLMLKDAFPERFAVVAVLFLALVAVLGHALNLALTFLSVLVHAIRLNTLEFSNHMGLQWSGIKFKPFSTKSSK